MAIPALNDLPFILAGPIVRRVTSKRAAVWIALRVPATVTLQVIPENAPASIKTSTPTPTFKVGSNLHLVLVDMDTTASPLQEDVVYFYNLQFAPKDGSAIGGDLRSSGNLTKGAPSPDLMSYGVAPAAMRGLPSFVLPQSDLTKLLLSQASCRKAHADSLDTMLILDAELSSSAATTSFRPQQLFLTGDQIYADDVSDAQMFFIRQVAAQMIGTEKLTAEVGTDDPRLAVGHRAPFVRDVCKFTTDPDSLGTLGKNHLLTYGEWCAMYLLMWGDALWPSPLTLPDFNDIYPGEATKDKVNDVVETETDTAKFTEFKRENAAVQSFVKALPKARRALANIATYMLLDDHEICDDFYLNRKWISDILETPTGMTSSPGIAAIRNGLLAYGLFQGWGNQPGGDGPPPAPPPPGLFQPLVQRAANWAAANFPLTGADVTDIGVLVGLPIDDPAPDGEFPRAPGTGAVAPLPYHYKLTFANYEVLALDARTRRLYPTAPNTGPCGLLSPSALEAQIPASAPQWQSPGEGVTIVVTPAPWTTLSFIENRQIQATTPESIVDLDVELLHFDAPSYDGMLARCAAREGNGRARVVVFCGDVHHAYATRVEYWSRYQNPLVQTPLLADTRAIFAQFISSAVKNQSTSLADFAKTGTMLAHFAGFRGQRREITRLGWRALTGDTLDVGTATVDTSDNPEVPDTRDVTWSVPVSVRNNTAITELERERKRYISVTPGASPQIDWRVHRQLFSGLARGGAANPVNSVTDFLKGLLSALFEWLFGYVDVAKGGQDIVGVNNISFFKLNWDVAGSKSARHELRWFNKSYKELYTAQANDPGDGSAFLNFQDNLVQQLPMEFADPPPPTGKIDLSS